MTDFLGHSLSLRQITIHRCGGVFGNAGYKYTRRRLQECLATLGKRFGYANSSKVKAIRHRDHGLGHEA